jgi:hypothetical protein
MSALYNSLYEKPQIGMISGFASGILATIQSILTDDAMVKMASNLGSFCGAAIACITVIIQLIKFYDVIKIRITTKK